MDEADVDAWAWRIARDDEIDARRAPRVVLDQLVLSTHTIWAWCAVCHRKIGPYSTTWDATKKLRSHMLKCV